MGTDKNDPDKSDPEENGRSKRAEKCLHRKHKPVL